MFHHHHDAHGSTADSASHSARTESLSWPTHNVERAGSPANSLLAPVATANCCVGPELQAEGTAARGRGVAQSCLSKRSWQLPFALRMQVISVTSAMTHAWLQGMSTPLTTGRVTRVWLPRPPSC